MKRWEQEQERRDYRAGMIASTIANANRDPKKRRKPYEARDFMPARVRPRPKPMTPQATVDFVAKLNAALGGRDLRVAS